MKKKTSDDRRRKQPGGKVRRRIRQFEGARGYKQPKESTDQTPEEEPQQESDGQVDKDEQ